MLAFLYGNLSQKIFTNFFISVSHYDLLPSVLWRYWLGVRKSIRPVKTEWWGTGVIICLKRVADDLHMVQLMPLPSHHLLLQWSPEWFTFLVPAYLDCPGKRPLNMCSNAAVVSHYLLVLLAWWYVFPQNSDPSDVIYTSGCIEQGEVWVNQNLIPVAGVFVGLALVQVSNLHTAD